MFGEQMHWSLLLILLMMLMIWGAMVGSILLLFNPYSNVLHDVEFINVIIGGIAAIVEIVIYYFNIGRNLKMEMIFYVLWWKIMREIFDKHSTNFALLWERIHCSKRIVNKFGIFDFNEFLRWIIRLWKLVCLQCYTVSHEIFSSR